MEHTYMLIFIDLTTKPLYYLSNGYTDNLKLLKANRCPDPCSRLLASQACANGVRQIRTLAP